MISFFECNIYFYCEAFLSISLTSFLKITTIYELKLMC
ncbi:hypothetical protein ECDEC12A_5535 [Escherichia coli DEC12A]|nr:hypothetical protein ECDEC12A_5535 [Escherichia coli DEC12A]EHX45261.1 hypothetical protein ECDEC13A_3260 [Escherichia coli DEC13A]EHX46644.1 hypothetical protein ECDEC12E_3615 [Escherichia coli DEC12E]EHX59199.1 hypothetical protein ECDEC13B_3107 [Escherichia coli DEC13B]KDW57590.1 hypothetical protein AB82_2708 [Escherichia coli 2-005-03_S3_C1]KDW66234.1 hypothetical protein AC40_2483 [Escherichia coli 2-005-03_S3_C3]